MSSFLTSLRIRNFRSYKDSGVLEFAKINLFVGANNAGKTSILSCIELFMRSITAGGMDTPLLLKEMATFGSFDAALRKHWSKTEARAKGFELDFGVSESKGSETNYEFCFGEDMRDGSVKILSATYMKDESSFKVDFSKSQMTAEKNSKNAPQVSDTEKFNRVYFFHAMPFMVHQQGKIIGSVLEELTATQNPRSLEVVNAYRPIPRSLYVVDDPSMTAEDRGMISYLAGLWTGDAPLSKRIRDRIVMSLQTLGLTKSFEVKSATKRRSGGVFELRVAPSSSRQKVTIADAGFGLSQALPLVVYEARLETGALIAYQPEIHLHPRAQARLADLFVASVKRGNQVFVESHSVDLILRVQYLIATGAVSSKDIALFFVENVSGTTKVKKVGFSDSGQPDQPLPAGFLDVSYELAKDLMRARFQRQQAPSEKISQASVKK